MLISKSANCSSAMRCVAVALVAGWAVLGPLPAVAQSAIKVLVNGQPITTYDIRNRAQLLRLTSGGRAGEKQAIDELIEENLKLQEAKARGVDISEAEVDQAFATVASRTKLPPAQFSAALRQAGVDPDTLKERIRAEIAWGRVVRARFRATVEISESEVAKAVAGQADKEAEQEMISEYMLQPIIFVVPAKGGEGVASQQQRQALAFRSRFQGCDSALQVAKDFKGVVVKPTVRREETDLSDAMRKALAPLDVGDISPPERVSEGVQLLGICRKLAVPGQTKATEEARAELSNEQGQLLARRYLRDLRSDAVIDYK